MSKELKEVYSTIKDQFTNAKDAFYDTDNKDFHLLVSAECLAYADCLNIIADKLIELNKGE